MVENIDTRPGYRVFAAVVEMRGPRLSDVANSCGLPTSRTRLILNGLVASGLVDEFVRRFYVAEGGVAKVARHNRNHVQSVKRLITSAPTSGETNAPILDKRDKAVNQAHLRFQLQGFGVGDGRRMGIGGLRDPKLWFPDLWVNIRADIVAVPFVLHAVLVDPSTRSNSAVKTILRDFRSAAIRDPKEHPLLVIVRDEAAAKLFERVGDDLNMMVATHGAFLTGDHSGPGSVWRYRGQIADVDRLARLTLDKPLT